MNAVYNKNLGFVRETNLSGVQEPAKKSSDSLNSRIASAAKAAFSAVVNFFNFLGSIPSRIYNYFNPSAAAKPVEVEANKVAKESIEIELYDTAAPEEVDQELPEPVVTSNKTNYAKTALIGAAAIAATYLAVGVAANVAVRYGVTNSYVKGIDTFNTGIATNIAAGATTAGTKIAEATKTVKESVFNSAKTAKTFIFDNAKAAASSVSNMPCNTFGIFCGATKS